MSSKSQLKYCSEIVINGLSTRRKRRLEKASMLHKRIIRKVDMMSQLVLIITTLLITYLPSSTDASGVFELELLKLDLHSNLPPRTVFTKTNDTSPQIISTKANETSTLPPNVNGSSSIKSISTTKNVSPTASTKLSNNDLIRVFVCLKEPFTSQVGRPCPFGNASILIHPDQDLNNNVVNPIPGLSIERTVARIHDATMKKSPIINSMNNSTNDTKQQHQNQLASNPSPSNLIRINFTFRWTKSFTLILMLEEPEEISAQTHSNANPNANETGSAPGSAGTGTGGGNQWQVVSLKATSDPNSSKHASNSSGNPKPLPKSMSSEAHVLTEIDVTPYLESSPQKRWTERFSRRLDSTLVYRFRVFCNQNYHGDGCTTFCRPRDDQFGHYNCSSSGHKVCLDGWFGLDCDKPKCRSGCNLEHGYCDKPNTCACRPGWTGPRCDECITYPGCANGYCLAPWQCLCRSGWSGLLCDDSRIKPTVDLSKSICDQLKPCKNDAICLDSHDARQNATGQYACQCQPGFEGVHCELNSPITSIDQLDQFVSTSGSSAAATTTCGITGLGPLSDARSSYLHACYNGGRCMEIESLTDEETNAFAMTTPSEIADEDHELAINETTKTVTRFVCECPESWSGDHCEIPVTQSTTDNLAEADTSSTTININTSSLPRNLDQTTQPGPIFQPRINSDDISIGLITNQQKQLQQQPQYHHHHQPHLITHFHHRQNHRLELGHLMSGVMLASIFGVFLAVFALPWVCLIVIRRSVKFNNGRLPLIQMFVQMPPSARSSSGANWASDDGRSSDQAIDIGDQQNNQGGALSARLRRFHERLRNSFRSSRISSGSKLSIENVLRPRTKQPPPSYEESACSTNQLKQISLGAIGTKHNEFMSNKQQSLCHAPATDRYSNGEDIEIDIDTDIDSGTDADANGEHIYGQEKVDRLVINVGPEGEVEGDYVGNGDRHGIASIRQDSDYATTVLDHIREAQLTCPRHGEYFRQQMIDELRAATSTSSSLNNSNSNNNDTNLIENQMCQSNKQTIERALQYVPGRDHHHRPH